MQNVYATKGVGLPAVVGLMSTCRRTESAQTMGIEAVELIDFSGTFHLGILGSGWR